MKEGKGKVEGRGEKKRKKKNNDNNKNKKKKHKKKKQKKGGETKGITKKKDFEERGFGREKGWTPLKLQGNSILEVS